MATIPTKMLKRDFTIDNFKFSLGITRLIAVEGYKKYPDFWKLLNEENSKELIQNRENYAELMKQDSEKSLDYFIFGEKANYYKKEIVEYLLPTLLEKGGTNLENYNSYKDYANALLEFCNEQNILEDYVETPTEEEIKQLLAENPDITFEEIIQNQTIKGLYTIIMEFINLGFTLGNSPLKPKTKIMAM